MKPERIHQELGPPWIEQLNWIERSDEQCVRGAVKNGPNQSHSAAARTTDCSQQPLLFADLGPRQVVAEFTAGDLSSDGGVLLLLLLLHQVDHGLGLPFSCSALPGIAALDLDGDGLNDLIVPTLKECPLPAGLTTAY